MCSIQSIYKKIMMKSSHLISENGHRTKKLSLFCPQHKLYTCISREHNHIYFLHAFIMSVYNNLENIILYIIMYLYNSFFVFKVFYLSDLQCIQQNYCSHFWDQTDLMYSLKLHLFVTMGRFSEHNRQHRKPIDHLNTILGSTDLYILKHHNIYD